MTRSDRAASAAMLTAAVVFPTPPFPLHDATTNIFEPDRPVSGRSVGRSLAPEATPRVGKMRKNLHFPAPNPRARAFMM